jgi:hypothetical protein
MSGHRLIAAKSLVSRQHQIHPNDEGGELV